MVRLLLEPYNVLILDEPTNHLDMRTKDILKDALKKFEGTVLSFLMTGISCLDWQKGL